MQKEYEAPKVVLTVFQTYDVITVSATNGGSGALPGIVPPGW